jgi:hypothetical protein
MRKPDYGKRILGNGAIALKVARTTIGVASTAVYRGIDINNDLNGSNYTVVQKRTAVTIDSIKIFASLGAMAA